jgi:zinc ribbon protein
MRSGLLGVGIFLIILGFFFLVAVGDSLSNCPTGYVCSPNPVGLSLGILLMVMGFVLVILAYVLKPSGPSAPPIQSSSVYVAPQQGVGWAQYPPPPPPPARFCSACGAPNSTTAAFCDRCGRPLQPPP